MAEENTENVMDSIKASVVNETYEMLRTRFLRKGKGRKPDVTVDVPMTNMTLLQLHFIMLEGSETSGKLSQWFKYLFPGVSYPPDRVDRLIVRILNKAKNLSHPTELEHFLASIVHLDEISETLSAMTLTRESLLNPDHWQYSGPYSVTNQAVIDLESFKKYESVASDFSANWVLRLLNQEIDKGNVTQAKKAVEKMKQQKSKLSKNVKTNPTALADFLSQIFVLPKKMAMTVPVSETAKTNCICQSEKIEKKLRDDIIALKCQLSMSQDLFQQEANQNKVLQEELECSKSKVGKLQAENEELSIQIKKLKNKIKNMNRKPIEPKTSQESLRSEVYRLRRRCVQKDEKIRRLEEDIKSLNEELLDMPERNFCLKENGQYTDEVRLAVMQLQGEANVSASNCGKVIKIISERIFQTFNQDYPCTQTCINIADEGQFIAMKQLGAVLSNTAYTLHFDGTSRDGKKFVGCQASFKDGTSYSLGFQSVAKEDSDTMVDLAIGLINEVTDCCEEEKEELTKQIFDNLTSIMTDRAAAMKCFGQKLLDYLNGKGKSTAMKLLHCNAHFLLGVSSEVEKGLKELESKECLGRDQLAKFRGWSSQGESATARVIRTTCDVVGPRGDEKNGCRSEWLAFCEANGISSKIPSFRGNRFNCLFEAAASIIFHHQHLVEFFSNSLGRTLNMKLESVLADLKDPTILMHLLCVSLIFLNLTNPYWEILKKGASYEEFIAYVNTFYSSLNEFKSHPVSMTNFQSLPPTKAEIFFISTKSQLEICLENNAESVQASLKSLISHIIVVTERQLADFLEGGSFFHLEEADKDILRGCPITNLLGEKAFGDLDFDFQKRRHTSLHHRSSIHMIKKNQTAEWAAKHKDNISLMSEARKSGPELRKKHRLHEKQVLKALRERQLQNEMEKKERELKVVKQKEEIAARVHANGGPCGCSKDVSRLKERVGSRKKFVDAVKDEVRYIKQVIGKECNIKISVDGFELEQRLRQFLSPDENIEVRSPPAKRQRLSESSSEEEEDNEDVEKENSTMALDTQNFTFEFSTQGQWVAVFFDNNFYIGQVISVTSPNRANVKFLSACSARPSCYKWPQTEDIAETEARFVFSWDFDVVPTAGGRLWEVSSSRSIERTYQQLKDLI